MSLRTCGAVAWSMCEVDFNESVLSENVKKILYIHSNS